MNTEVMHLGNLAIEPDQYRARVGGRLVPLTIAQAKLLELLASRPDEVQSYRELAEALGSPETTPRELAVHMFRLREKLAGSAPYTIVTLHKRGYALSEQAPPGGKGVHRGPPRHRLTKTNEPVRPSKTRQT